MQSSTNARPAPALSARAPPRHRLEERVRATLRRGRIGVMVALAQLRQHPAQLGTDVAGRSSGAFSRSSRARRRPSAAGRAARRSRNAAPAGRPPPGRLPARAVGHACLRCCLPRCQDLRSPLAFRVVQLDRPFQLASSDQRVRTRRRRLCAAPGPRRARPAPGRAARPALCLGLGSAPISRSMTRGMPRRTAARGPTGSPTQLAGRAAVWRSRRAGRAAAIARPSDRRLERSLLDCAATAVGSRPCGFQPRASGDPLVEARRARSESPHDSPPRPGRARQHSRRRARRAPGRGGRLDAWVSSSKGLWRRRPPFVRLCSGAPRRLAGRATQGR